MPFQSEKQRRYLWANEPEIARDWTDTYGSKIHAADGGIMRLGFDNGGEVVDDMGHTYETSRYGNEYDPEYISEEDFNEMFGEETIGIGERITSGIDTVKDKFTGGVDYMKRLPGMAMGALSGIPGISFLMDAFHRPQYPSDTMSRSFAIGNPNATLGQQYAGGRLPGQDAFGINTISMMGNYPAYYDQYVRDYDAGKYSPTSKFAANKYAHAQAVNKANLDRIKQDFTVTAEDEEGAGNYVAPVQTTHTSTVPPSQRGGDSGPRNRPDKSGKSGHTNPGRNSYGPHMARGGIAGLWPR